MTYALAWPLQAALYARLAADPALAAIVGGRIYDAAPPETGEARDIYLTLGDETARDWSTADCAGATHDIRIAVTAPRAGFSEAKQAAAAVCDALLGAPLPLARGRVVTVVFRAAETERLADDALRRIALTFRALLEDA